MARDESGGFARRAGVSRRAALVAAGSAMLAGPALAQQQTSQRRLPLNVLSTIAMIGDVVRQIGGDRIRAETLLGAGVDPHLYRATREDIARMLRADVIFYNGLVLEGARVQHLAHDSWLQRASPEGREGLAAFREKRPPGWAKV